MNKLESVFELDNSASPFVIAELSGNHNQCLDTALQMVEEAANAGVDAIKLQTYKAETMTLDCELDRFVIKEHDNLWQGEPLFALYQRAATPWEWHEEIFSRARELGLYAFSSPFDKTSVDFLESLNVPCYKIASFECTDLPLLKHVAKTGKPVILSTGMATLSEIEEAVRCLRDYGCEKILLLKCTSAYPAKPQDSNLNTIAHMKSAFGCEVGLSDHTKGIGVAISASAIGAKVIEKHFVLDRRAGGVDAEFSLEPKEFQLLVQELKNSYQAMGEIVYGGSESERDSKRYRRSIYVTKNLKKGEIITKDHVSVLRPANGLEPKYLDNVIGKAAKSDLMYGQSIQWEHIV